MSVDDTGLHTIAAYSSLGITRFKLEYHANKLWMVEKE